MSRPAADLERARAARNRSGRRAAVRGRRALPRRLHRRRHVRLAAHEVPRAGDEGVAAVAPRAVRHRDPRRADRAVARAVPERRAVEVPAAQGVREPTITTLTRIGTVEGFGSIIRHVHPATCSATSTRASTAPRSSTCDRGLFEAHARDEAGLGSRRRPQADVVRGARHRVRVARHRGRDADDARTHGDRFEPGPTAGSGSDAQGRRSDATLPRSRPHPRDDVAAHDLVAVHRDVGVPHRSRGPRRCCPTPISSRATAKRPRSSRCIRTDETPHVDYLRTALTEMRDRTFVGESGRKIAGAEVIGTLWDGRARPVARGQPGEHAQDRRRRGRARARRQGEPERDPRRVRRARAFCGTN